MTSHALYRVLLAMMIITMLSCRNSPTESEIAVVPTNVITHSQISPLTEAEIAIVQKLFKDNKISLSTLQPFRLYNDGGNYIVHCDQVVNGMEIFFHDVAYSFNRDGVVNPVIGDIITSVNVNTTPKVTPASAGNAFYESIAADPFHKSELSSIKNQSFNAEAGYYEINIGKGLPTKQFVLAWKLTIANGTGYPFAFIRADSLIVLYYFNGVIID
jgi:Zn-dependent metalloprotease